MSRYVYDVLHGFSPEIECYSIDESFLSLDGFGHRNLIAYGQEMRAKVRQWKGIPVAACTHPRAGSRLSA